jgi:replicative DNA helicase
MRILYYCPASHNAYYYNSHTGMYYVGNTIKTDPQTIMTWLEDHGAIKEVTGDREKFIKIFDNTHITRKMRRWEWKQ